MARVHRDHHVKVVAAAAIAVVGRSRAVDQSADLVHRDSKRLREVRHQANSGRRDQVADQIIATKILIKKGHVANSAADHNHVTLKTEMVSTSRIKNRRNVADRADHQVAVLLLGRKQSAKKFQDFSKNYFLN